MFDQPNPRLNGRNSEMKSQVFALTAGNDIAVTDLGEGTFQVSYVPKAPAILSITQDYNEYATTSGNQIAAYAHGKVTVQDNDSLSYTMTGYSDTVGQVITIVIQGQAAGAFTTAAVGGFKVVLDARVIAEATDDTYIITCFQGAGVNSCQAFSNSLGNQLTVGFGGSIAVDPEFTSGLGNVYMNSFDVQYKPAGSS